MFTKINPGFFIKRNQDILDSLSYPAEGNASCYEIEEHSQWFQARNQTISNIIKGFPFSGDFLDVGGGNGYQLYYLQQNLFKKQMITSAMCEPGRQGCTNAASRGVSNVYCCLVEDFPFDKFNIGGIGLFDVIEHIEDDAAFLNTIAKLVPKGTKIYITVPALKHLWSVEDQYAGHFRRYNMKEEARLLKETDLNLVYSGYFFSYYVPFVWLLRVLPEKLGKKVDNTKLLERESQYHRNSSKLDFLLNTLHNFELRFLAQRSMRNLLGTSRLIVLEK